MYICASRTRGGRKLIENGVSSPCRSGLGIRLIYYIYCKYIARNLMTPGRRSLHYRRWCHCSDGIIEFPRRSLRCPSLARSALHVNYPAAASDIPHIAAATAPHDIPHQASPRSCSAGERDYITAIYPRAFKMGIMPARYKRRDSPHNYTFHSLSLDAWVRLSLKLESAIFKCHATR